jgi:hypothetical protein
MDVYRNFRLLTETPQPEEQPVEEAFTAPTAEEEVMEGEQRPPA